MRTEPASDTSDAPKLAALRAAVLATRGWRDVRMPWRETSDPYAILVSEVMLQQTQVARVVSFYEAFLDTFPSLDALAAAPLAAVLERWQGLGYNRRALSLKRLAETLAREGDGALPRDPAALALLPGIGPATAGAVATYAFGAFAPFIETNVRAVFLHHLFADRDDVTDRELMPFVEATWDRSDPRGWGYALTDHGALLKRDLPNPGRRSRHHARQSRFEGSRRQTRARLLRAVLARPGGSAEECADALRLSLAETAEILDELASEGFLVREGERYSVST